MSDFNPEGLSDNNDWDDSWEFAWSEFDWERHLQDQDRTIQSYLSHYDRLVDRADRIDEVAHRMGWDQDDWTADEPESADSANLFADAEAGESRAPMDPYTIQKHPVYISTRSLFFWLHRAWEFIAPACGRNMPVRTAMAFASSLFRAEHYGLLATHSLDMGDFSLAVCQSKRALSELNNALEHLRTIDAKIHPALEEFQRQAYVRLFDIREIWLRVMRDCREEIDRRVNEGGES
jgi:hypothetical protein